MHLSSSVNWCVQKPHHNSANIFTSPCGRHCLQLCMEGERTFSAEEIWLIRWHCWHKANPLWDVLYMHGAWEKKENCPLSVWHGLDVVCSGSLIFFLVCPLAVIQKIFSCPNYQKVKIPLLNISVILYQQLRVKMVTHLFYGKGWEKCGGYKDTCVPWIPCTNKKSSPTTPTSLRFQWCFSTIC